MINFIPAYSDIFDIQRMEPLSKVVAYSTVSWAEAYNFTWCNSPIAESYYDFYYFGPLVIMFIWGIINEKLSINIIEKHYSLSNIISLIIFGWILFTVRNNILAIRWAIYSSLLFYIIFFVISKIKK